MDGWQGFLLAAAGIMLGWSLNQVSAWWGSRAERQRTYRRMLFFLLQLEWLFERLDVGGYVDHSLSRVKARTPEQVPPSMEAALRGQLVRLITRQNIQETAKELKELEVGYIEALKDLSHLAPFLAFRLEGKTNILKNLDGAQRMVGVMLDERDGLMSGLVADLGLSPEEKVQAQEEMGKVLGPQAEVLGGIVDTMAPDLLKEDLSTIRELMCSVALRIGPGTWVRTKRRVQRKNHLSDEEQQLLNKFMDDHLKGMVKMIEASGKERVPGSSALMGGQLDQTGSL